MIEIISKEDKAILVIQVEKINADSHLIESIKKPQVIHMYAYDLHLLFSSLNMETIIYYIDRFKIDYLCLNIPITKYIKTAKQLIEKMKLEGSGTCVICSGDAITPQISSDIGADGYTLNGDDLIRVMEVIDEKRVENHKRKET